MVWFGCYLFQEYLRLLMQGEKTRVEGGFLNKNSGVGVLMKG